MTLANELRHCAAHKPDPFSPFWVDSAKRLMRQAADALDAANEAVAAEYKRATADKSSETP
jgi:hypothetical protein